jgi:hypothetical protein
MKKTLLSILAIGSITAASAQMVDPSFESGPGAYWTESSTNFGTPLCDNATCGAALAFDGSWYFWGGGLAAGTLEQTLMAQQMTIPAGTTASIDFQFGNVGGDGSADDTFIMSIDGNPIFSVTGADTAAYALYTPVTVDISQYADGAQHYFAFVSYQDGGTNFLLDALNLTVNGQSQTGINDLVNREKEVVVYPSPANENINVQFNQAVSGSATITIFDATGSMVNRDQVNQITNKIFTMDVAQLPNGVYFMNVDNNGNQFQQRFVVAH